MREILPANLMWNGEIDHDHNALILTIWMIPDKRLTPNGRKKLHHLTESRLTKPWRALGNEVGTACGWSCTGTFVIDERIHWNPEDIDRCPDNDAVPSMLKPIIDGLVDAGVIRNDSQRWCQELTIGQTRHAANPTHIVLTITRRERLRRSRSQRPRRKVGDVLD